MKEPYFEAIDMASDPEELETVVGLLHNRFGRTDPIYIATYDDPDSNTFYLFLSSIPVTDGRIKEWAEENL